MSENAISQPSGVLHVLHLLWYAMVTAGEGGSYLVVLLTFLNILVYRRLIRTRESKLDNMRLRSNIVIVASTFIQPQCANK